MTKTKAFQKDDTEKKSDSTLFEQVKKDYRWKVFGQSAFITLSSIFIFGGVGWLIDRWILGGGHAFLVTLLIISYPVTQFALYKKMKNFNPLKKDR